MKQLITITFLFLAVFGYSQDYITDTLSVSNRGFVIRYTLETDTTLISQEVENLEFEVERLLEEADRIREDLIQTRRKLRKYEAVLERKRRRSVARGQSLGYKEKY